MGSNYELATAYVQILPTTKGFKSKLQEAIGSDVESSGTDSGSSWGEKFGNGAKAAVKAGAAACATVLAAAAAGAVALGKEVVEQYSEYEQLSQGAELMWGEAYSYIAEQAKNAFSSVQMSTNDYLEQANYYATGLKTALDGDSQAAATLANDIITAQADIVAATGNSSEAVENAFEGVMRGNYTMLDNLGLGISGTKEGMQDVIDKVNEWRTEQGLAGDLVIDSLADCEQALVDYVEMQGMAGYAADEGAKTISGSFTTLEASWDNFITGLGDSDADIKTLAENLVTAFSNVITNIAPIVANIVEALPTAIQAIADALPVLIPSVMSAVQSLLLAIVDNLDSILDAVLSIVDSLIDMLVENLPTILPKLVTFVLELITGIAGAIIENIGPIIEAVLLCLAGILDAIGTWFAELLGFVDEEGDGIWDDVGEWFANIGTSIWEWLSGICLDIIEWFNGICEDVTGFFINIWKSISEWFTGLIEDIGGWLSDVITDIGDFFTDIFTSIGTWLKDSIWTPISEFFSKAWELGKSLVTGLWDGITGAAEWLWDKITGWISGIWDGIKDFFGIHSPSTEMAWIGEMITEGLANGIEDNADKSILAAEDMVSGINDTMSGLVGGNIDANMNTSLASDIIASSHEMDALDRISALLEMFLPELADNDGYQIMLDSDTLAGKLAPKINREFERMDTFERRGVGCMA